jgi:flagellar biosynthesis anti-sigma factor FlgM
MRIDGFQNIPAVLQSLKVDKALESTRESAEKTSTVSFSSFAETLQALQRESAKTLNARSARVEQLAQQAQTGKLTVNLEKLATNLVNSQVINTKG